MRRIAPRLYEHSSYDQPTQLNSSIGQFLVISATELSWDESRAYRSCDFEADRFWGFYSVSDKINYTAVLSMLSVKLTLLPPQEFSSPPPLSDHRGEAFGSDLRVGQNGQKSFELRNWITLKNIFDNFSILWGPLQPLPKLLVLVLRGLNTRRVSW